MRRSGDFNGTEDSRRVSRADILKDVCLRDGHEHSGDQLAGSPGIVFGDLAFDAPEGIGIVANPIAPFRLTRLRVCDKHLQYLRGTADHRPIRFHANFHRDSFPGPTSTINRNGVSMFSRFTNTHVLGSRPYGMAIVCTD